MSAGADALADPSGWATDRPGDDPGDRAEPDELTIEKLRRRADFLAAARHGRKVARRSLVLQARQRDDAKAKGDACASPANGRPSNPRVGFTVSRKVGNAVERNRVRRRLREAVRLRAAPLVRAGYDYVVIGRRAALTTSFATIVSDLEQAFRRTHETAPERALKGH